MKNGETGKFWERFKERFAHSDDLPKAFRNDATLFKLIALNEEVNRDHNMGVAKIMLDLNMDINTVIAAMLHRSLGHGMTPKQIEEGFGKEIAEIVDSKARFERAMKMSPEEDKDYNGKTKEKESSNRKIMVVLTTNPNVVIMHLGEMLDKLRKIGDMPGGEREDFIWHIKEIYAPLAHKLNIYSISSELNDLAFRHEDPKTYYQIDREAKIVASKASSAMEKTKQALAEELAKSKIRAEISGRVKTVFSTHQKMKRKNTGFSGIYDLLAIRVITDSLKECYETLGIVHSKWRPVPGEFDDYIAK